MTTHYQSWDVAWNPSFTARRKRPSKDNSWLHQLTELWCILNLKAKEMWQREQSDTDDHASTQWVTSGTNDEYESSKMQYKSWKDRSKNKQMQRYVSCNEMRKFYSPSMRLTLAIVNKPIFYLNAEKLMSLRTLSPVLPVNKTKAEWLVAQKCSTADAAFSTYLFMMITRLKLWWSNRKWKTRNQN